jgi:alpha-tubulin suppressor-like RCC1 family protein
MLKSFTLLGGLLFALLSGCAKDGTRSQTTVPLKVLLTFPENGAMRLAATAGSTATPTLESATTPTSETNATNDTSQLNPAAFETPRKLLAGAEERFAHKRVFRWFSYRILNGSREVKRGSILIENRDILSLDPIELEAKINDNLQLDFSFMQVDFMSASDADDFCNKGAPGFVRTWKASEQQIVREGGEIALTFNPNGKSIVQMAMLRVPFDSSQSNVTKEWKATLQNSTTDTVLDKSICVLEHALSGDNASDALYMRAPVFAVPLESLQFLFMTNDSRIKTMTVEENSDRFNLNDSEKRTLNSLGASATFKVETKENSWFLSRTVLGDVLPRAFVPLTGTRLFESRIQSVALGMSTGASTNASGAATILQKNSHQCAIQNGRLFCWGANSDGQLGFEATNSEAQQPQTPSGMDTGVVGVATGRSHTCAISGTEAEVKCWGKNDFGQLGQGTSSTTTLNNQPISLSPRLTSVRAIAAGESHTCALASESLFCWGSNDSGQLGLPSNGAGSSLVMLATPTEISLGGRRVSALATRRDHTCALSSDGEVICFGSNSFGQLGYSSTVAGSPSIAVTPDTANALTPTTTGVTSTVALTSATQIAVGNDHSCAIQKGQLLCWGSNVYGQLGLEVSICSNETPKVVPGFDSEVTAVAAGEHHTCAIKSGVLWCWGRSDFGQVAPGKIHAAGPASSKGTCASPDQPLGIHTPTLVLEKGVTAVSAGSGTCAVLNGRELKCWGLGSGGP